MRPKINSLSEQARAQTLRGRTHTHTLQELIGQKKMSWTSWRVEIAKEKVYIGQKA